MLTCRFEKPSMISMADHQPEWYSVTSTGKQVAIGEILRAAVGRNRIDRKVAGIAFDGPLITPWEEMVGLYWRGLTKVLIKLKMSIFPNSDDARCHTESALPAFSS
jgi:hypothetical protein